MSGRFNPIVSRKAKKDHPWRQGYQGYQAQPFASRDIAARCNAHSNDTTTAKGAISSIEL
jgi:hypothetical protein